jgi:hypothetical protein
MAAGAKRGHGMSGLAQRIGACARDMMDDK